MDIGAAMEGAEEESAGGSDLQNGGKDERQDDQGLELAVVGPLPARATRPKRPLEFERAFLDALPSAAM